MNNLTIHRIFGQYLESNPPTEISEIEIESSQHGMAEFRYGTERYLLCSPKKYERLKRDCDRWKIDSLPVETLLKYVPLSHHFTDLQALRYKRSLQHIQQIGNTADNDVFKVLLGKNYKDCMLDIIDVNDKSLDGYAERVTIRYNSLDYYLYKYLGNEDINED